MKEEMNNKKYGKYEAYEIEDIARSMVSLEECKKDKEKMGYVLEALAEMKKDSKKEIKSIEDLIEARQRLGQESEGNDEDGADS